MDYPTTTLRYEKHALDGVFIDGQIWLRGGQIGPALGYADQRGLNKLYRRHKGEFSEREARILPARTNGGEQEVLIFSLRGAERLGMLARTPEGEAFRTWVLDVLEGRRQRKAVQQLWLPGTCRVSSETARALQDVLQLIDDGYPPRGAVEEILNGSRPLSRDPEVDNILERMRLGRKMKSEGARIEADALRDASRRNYSKEFIQLELIRSGGDSPAAVTLEGEN